MQIILRMGMLLISPYLLLVYWRNSMKQLNDIHAYQNLNFEE